MNAPTVLYIEHHSSLCRQLRSGKKSFYLLVERAGRKLTAGWENFSVHLSARAAQVDADLRGGDAIDSHPGAR